MNSLKQWIATLIISLLFIIIFTSCESTSTINITHVPLPPSHTAEPTSTFTLIPPTITLTSTREATRTSRPSKTSTSTELPPYTNTPSPIATKTHTPTPTSETSLSYISGDSIVFYLIHLGTGGPIGCGDSLVAISTGQLRTGNVEKDVQLAVDAIFSIGQYSLGFYNATYPSSLRFSGLQMENGEAVVDLNGSYVKPENACDASRYRAQVWTTIQQFPEITRAVPKVRDALLGDLLSIYSDGNN